MGGGDLAPQDRGDGTMTKPGSIVCQYGVIPGGVPTNRGDSYDLPAIHYANASQLLVTCSCNYIFFSNSETTLSSRYIISFLKMKISSQLLSS